MLQLLQFGLAAGAYDLCANLAAALQDRYYNRFAFRPASSDLARPLVRVHIAGFASDEGFVSLHFTTEHAAGLIVLHRKPCTLQHEPCGLLGYADRSVNLPR